MLTQKLEEPKDGIVKPNKPISTISSKKSYKSLPTKVAYSCSECNFTANDLFVLISHEKEFHGAKANVNDGDTIS